MSSSRIIPSIAKLPHKSILELTGPDSQKFLKGLSCKDVDSLKGGYSGFLNASGRVLHTTFIFPISSSRYLVSHESNENNHPSPLQTFLPPFKLRAKVKIRDVSDQWDTYASWGQDLEQDNNNNNNNNVNQKGKGKGKQPDRIWKFGSGGASESQYHWENNEPRDLELSEKEIGCWDLRAGWGINSLGRQILVPKGDQPSLTSSHDLTSTESYHLKRMILGVPEGPDEIIPGHALPLESCMDLHGGVDFRKGCYLGQELTVRTYHTGATRKRILPIRLIPLNKGGSLSDYIHPASSSSSSDPSVLSGGIDIGGDLDITYHPPSSAPSKKSRSAGKILTLKGSIGLGLVRLEMAERSWWSNDISNLSIKDWQDNNNNIDIGKLTTQIGDETYGVYVDKGEAYREALKHMS
ncbi:uncharacterized protein IL334_000227 [Kwoniella shivajii]|uniref:CAF17 C-terminal domain-containing protein n=1 Tax=Kwoniella shivajii TaxID=564305 RepID=A0ABZ1CNK1_9TREE|nr:hypothetical protein IL334_000227 [Kwoniella shivajii]